MANQPDARALAEAEARLADLERRRPEYETRWVTRLADLERRFREAVEWCRRHVDLGDVRNALRPRSLAPAGLARDRWQLVNDVTSTRGHELGVVDVRSLDSPAGRLLVYYPDAELSDGAAEMASQGFFDTRNAPPWGTWIGYFEDPSPTHSDYGSYLVAWVPEPLVPLVSDGIDVNPEACIAWLDGTDVGVRPIIERFHTGDQPG